MAKDTPFGQAIRMRVLRDYFDHAPDVTADNAWEHVYRCLLWMNVGAGLAHIYDSTRRFVENIAVQIVGLCASMDA